MAIFLAKPTYHCSSSRKHCSCLYLCVGKEFFLPIIINTPGDLGRMGECITDENAKNKFPSWLHTLTTRERHYKRETNKIFYFSCKISHSQHKIPFNIIMYRTLNPQPQKCRLHRWNMHIENESFSIHRMISLWYGVCWVLVCGKIHDLYVYIECVRARIILHNNRFMDIESSKKNVYKDPLNVL